MRICNKCGKRISILGAYRLHEGNSYHLKCGKGLPPEKKVRITEKYISDEKSKMNILGSLFIIFTGIIFQIKSWSTMTKFIVTILLIAICGFILFKSKKLMETE